MTDSFELLTPSERRILYQLLVDGDQKSVARSLDLSPETVKTHLRNAREKCGVASSFALAKAVYPTNLRPPKRGIPQSRGGFTEASSPSRSSTPVPRFGNSECDELRENFVPFTFDDLPSLALPDKQRSGRGDPAIFHRLLMIGALTLVVALAIILAFPLSESFQRLANVIDPPT